MQPATTRKHLLSKPKIFLTCMVTAEYFVQKQEGKCRGMGWQTWVHTDERMAASQRWDFMASRCWGINYNVFCFLENYSFPILSSKKHGIQFFTIIITNSMFVICNSYTCAYVYTHMWIYTFQRKVLLGFHMFLVCCGLLFECFFFFLSMRKVIGKENRK